MGGIRENIGKRILKRKKKDVRRSVQVHNFDTARSAVILFPADNPEDFPAIKAFRKFLEESGVKCKAYGYVPDKEIPQEMLFWRILTGTTNHRESLWIPFTPRIPIYSSI